MKDFKKRLIGLAIMMVTMYGVSLAVLQVKQFIFYSQNLHPLTFIIGIACLFGFGCGFILVIADYSVIRQHYYQKRLEDFK